jgi:hypothetical protein
MFWEDITIEAYDAWMMSLQSELEDYESCGDEEGSFQIECQIRSLASRYADQIKRERLK